MNFIKPVCTSEPSAFAAADKVFSGLIYIISPGLRKQSEQRQQWAKETTYQFLVHSCTELKVLEFLLESGLRSLLHYIT